MTMKSLFASLPNFIGPKLLILKGEKVWRNRANLLYWMQWHPVMLIDKADLERRLNSPRNLLNVLPPRDNSIREPLHPPHNGHGAVAPCPTSLQIIAGVLSKTESAKDVAGALGMPIGAVRKSGDSSDAVVADAVERTTGKIRDMALEKLMSSLGVIDDSTLANCGAKDASTVARNLATVVDKLSPKDAAASFTQLIIYAPQQRTEKHYDTIEVKALP